MSTKPPSSSHLLAASALALLASPALADDLVIANATHSLSPAQTLSVTGHEYVSFGGAPGTFLQTGGAHSVFDNLYVGFGGGHGHYSLTGGTLSVGRFVSVAHTGSGSFHHAAGTHAIADDLYVGYAPGASGTYSLSGTGDLSVADSFLLGNIGTGSFVQTGGTITVGGLFALATAFGSRGHYSLSAGSLTVPQAEIVGYEGNATFAQSGGTHAVNALSIGYVITNNRVGTGTYLLTGGVLNATSILLYPRGTLTVSSAATLHFSSLAQIGGSLTHTGPFSLAQSSFSLSAGTVSFGGDLTIGTPPTPVTAAALAAPSSLSITGGSATVAGALTLHASPDTSVSLSGGSLTLHQFPTILAPGTLDVTGGTLLLPAASAPELRQALLDGRISSSAPDPADTHSLGYRRTTTSLLVQPTLTGDANLDGRLTPDDYALLDRGFATGGAFWWEGDFNHDGAVTTADYLLIDRTLLLTRAPVSLPDLLAQRESQFGPAYVSTLLAAVPEPVTSTSLLLTLSLPRLLARRRKT